MEFDDDVFPSQLESLLPELREDDPFQDDLRYDSFIASLMGVDRDTYEDNIPIHIRYLLDAVSEDDPLHGSSPSKSSLPSLKGPPFTIRQIAGKGLGAVAIRRIPAGSIVLDDPFALSIQEPVQEPTSEEEATELLSVVLIQLLGQYVRLPLDARRQFAGLHPHIKEGTHDWFRSNLSKLGITFDETELEFVVRLYCTFETNVFSTALPGGGLNWRLGRLFLTTSRINHACQPNTRSRQTSEGNKVVTSIRDIEEGEELTLRYLDHKLFSRSEWQAETQPSQGELLALVARINAAAEELDAVKPYEASKARESLLHECERLIASLQDPHAAVWPRAFQVNVAVSIDIAATLGIWKSLRRKEFVTLSEILSDTEADAGTTVRVLRQLTAAGLLSDVPDIKEPGYSLTHLGRPYLDSNHVSFNRFILREVVPTASSSVEQKCFSMNHYEGLPRDGWFRLVQDPVRAADMVRGMRSLSSGGLTPTAYPFGSELEKLDIKESDIAIVDVAGGQGHIMDEVRKQNPGLKGRIVVQDLQAVLNAAPDGPPDGVEFMCHDIFKPQPLKTAHVYYLRHVVHDWDDDSVTVILDHLTPIMKARPETKLLLADLVVPNTTVSMQEAVRDFTMFRIGGMERTEAQWRHLLAKSGLGIKRIWRGSEPEACVECTLIENDRAGDAVPETDFLGRQDMLARL